jgi:hypothetical protein
MEWELAYCSVLAVGIERSAGRGDPAPLAIREVLETALRESFQQSRIDWRAYRVDDLGDGLRVTTPLGTRKAALIHPLLEEVAARLRAHNRLAGPATAIRARMALHAGDLRLGPSGEVRRSAAGGAGPAARRADGSRRPGRSPAEHRRGAGHVATLPRGDSSARLSGDGAGGVPRGGRQQQGVHWPGLAPLGRTANGAGWACGCRTRLRGGARGGAAAFRAAADDEQSVRARRHLCPAERRPAHQHHWQVLKSIMDQELTALAEAGAAVVVSAMATDLWRSVEEGTLAVFHRLGRNQQLPVSGQPKQGALDYVWSLK